MMVCHGGAMAIQMFCWQGVLKKYPIVWLGEGKPVNTCTSPSILRICPHSHEVCPPPKKFVNINKFSIKIVDSFIGIIYNSTTILFSSGGILSNFLWELYFYIFHN
jgi:hypothetical protein